jgi:hypothetical protein
VISTNEGAWSSLPSLVGAGSWSGIVRCFPVVVAGQECKSVRQCAFFRTCLPLALSRCAFVDLVFLAEQSAELCSSSVALESALTNTPCIPDCCILRQNQVSLSLPTFWSSVPSLFFQRLRGPSRNANSFAAISEGFLDRSPQGLLFSRPRMDAQPAWRVKEAE